MRMNELFIDKKLMTFFMKILHIAILILNLTGWLLPHKWLWIYLIWIPLMIIQWQLNQGTCVLTNLENYLVGEINRPKSQQQGQFIKSLFLKLCGFTPSDTVLKYLIYLTIFCCWSFAFWRYYT